MERAAEKERLIEMLGVHFEREDQLAPVAARILATLIVAGKEGTTFDQLVNSLEASKSTVCTNLNMLESARKISYYTVPGDRKRYFSLSPSYFEQRIDQLIAGWNYEMEMYRQLINVQASDTRSAAQPFIPTASFPQKALPFLTEAIAALQQLKQTILHSTDSEKK